MEKRPFFRAATPLRPYRGNTARADMAGLGSIGFSILAGDARSFFVRIKSLQTLFPSCQTLHGNSHWCQQTLGSAERL